MVKGERGSDVRKPKVASLRGWGLYQMAGCGGTISYLLKDVDEIRKMRDSTALVTLLFVFFFFLPQQL